MEAAAPDLIHAVIGFRQWRVRGSELWALRADDEVWVRGVQTSRCLSDIEHVAPENGCTCGYYAWYAPPPRTASAGTAELVAGAIAAWGRVELHAHGMRVQHAMVVALALPFSWGAKRQSVLAAARALEVPAVPARRLVAAACEHGDVVPREMRPPDLTPNKRAAPGEPDPARLYAVADGLRQRRR
jgi:hypothetical protein